MQIGEDRRLRSVVDATNRENFRNLLSGVKRDEITASVLVTSKTFCSA